MTTRKRDRHILRRILVLVGTVMVVGVVGAASYVGIVGWKYYETLQEQVDDKFRGRRWDLPSRVYSAPFAVYPGMDLDGIGFIERLTRLGYVEVPGPADRPGDYRWLPSGGLEVVLRGSSLMGEEARRVFFDLMQRRVVRAVTTESGEELPIVELAPEPIAGIYDQVWESRDLVMVADVPSLLIQSILATEDRRFFEHEGVDWRAVLRALWVNFRAGGVRQGGSTLTQQLMKNFFLSTDRTMERKFVELAMALIAERRYSKLEILENYLNEIYLGQNGARGVFGIREGSRFYFGKDPAELSLAQMALLAGLVQAPNRYSPYHAPERALERREVVLTRMHRAGMITDADYAAARAEPLNLRQATPSPRTAPYFVDYVRDELAGTYGPTVLTQDGLQIYTTLDAQLQLDAEQAVRDGLARLEEQHPSLRPRQGETALEAALVAIQPQTGEIKAMVGGRGYGTSQFNRATQARRQVGSLFKPVVFATALAMRRETGETWLPTSRVEDSPFEWAYGSEIWKPANYADRYLGFVTMRAALERSLNAATARTAQEIDLPPILATASRLGFDDELPAVPAIVLGAGEASPLRVARVYATFANGGLRPNPLAGRRITTGHGEVLEWRGVRLERAITPEVAFLITHMLQGVLERGTGRAGQLAVPAAGKTGTTDGYRDAWFAGYTPELVAVVWVGFDHGKAVGLPGSEAALPIWSEFMSKATAGRPMAVFQPPPGIGYARIDPASGGLATGACPESIEEAFPVDAVPATPCALHSLPVPWSDEEAAEDGVEARPKPSPSAPGRRWWPF